MVTIRYFQSCIFKEKRKLEIKGRRRTRKIRVTLHCDPLKKFLQPHDFLTFNRVLEIAYYAQNACASISRIIQLTDQNIDFTDNLDASLFRFRSITLYKNIHRMKFKKCLLKLFFILSECLISVSSNTLYLVT